MLATVNVIENYCVQRLQMECKKWLGGGLIHHRNPENVLLSVQSFLDQCNRDLSYCCQMLDMEPPQFTFRIHREGHLYILKDIHHHTCSWFLSLQVSY